MKNSLRILSRHPTANGLRRSIFSNIKAVYRHGSTTDGNFDYEINSVESIRNSADKLEMKKCFDLAEVNHAKWIKLQELTDDFLKSIQFPENKIIIKHRLGSRGTGNYLISTKDELDKFLKSKSENLSNYIVEEFKRYVVEYRLHVSNEGCFYACRKVLKNTTPKDERFQRHDDNCSWLLESNPKFNKPENWNEIVEHCIKALKTINADVLAFDVKCTSTKEAQNKKCKFIIIESCSAPSFGVVTLEKYKEELLKIIKNKYENNSNK